MAGYKRRLVLMGRKRQRPLLEMATDKAGLRFRSVDRHIGMPGIGWEGCEHFQISNKLGDYSIEVEQYLHAF